MAKRRNARRFSKKALAILLTLVMAFSLFNMMALAAGQLICDKEEHAHAEACYEERTHEHNDDCYRTHRHSFGCAFGCRYDEGERVLSCGMDETYEELVCGKDTHSHGTKCYKEEDYVSHLDIHIGLTAKYILDGETYTESIELTKEDYTSGRLQITSTGSFRITSTEIYDAGQRRFNGSFAVGTYENPVYYTITLVKDVAFNINGETVTVPMTFSKTVNYWGDNICESLFATRGYKNGSWAKGEFVGGNMDFKLGASESTGSNTQPDPTEPVKHTLTVQKNVSGVSLNAAKTYSFGIYSGNEKIDTVNVTVSAGGTTAIGTTALEADTAYFVVEEGSPAIEGYTLTTSVAVGSGEARTGVTSDSFTLTGDASVVFTNAYEEIVIPPVIPDPVYFDLTVKYVDVNGAALAADDVTTDLEEGASYSTAPKAIEGYTFKNWDDTSDAASGTMDSDKTVVYVYEENAPVIPEPKPEPDPVYFDLTVKYVDTDGNAIAADDVTEDIEEGASYNTTAKAIEGYTFKQWDGSSDSVGGVMNSDKTVVYVYEKDAPPAPPADPDPQPSVVVFYYYDLTVNYVDTEGNALQAPIVEYNKFQNTAYTTVLKAFEGYTFVETTGDAVSGVMDSDKVVTYIYMADEVIEDIPEEDPPLVDLPDEPGETPDEPVDIPEDDVPLADLPDEDVPLADTPKTGDNGMGLYIALMILSAMGLAWVVISGRRTGKN